VERVGPEALTRLLEYQWPGNVRELEHVIERAVLLCAKPTLEVSDLAPALHERAPADGVAFSGQVIPMRELQRRYAAWALEQLGGRRVQTADRLDVDYKTLQRWLAGDADRTT
jgi:two-component system response regulator HydG